MKLKFFIPVFFVAVVALIAYSQTNRNAFSPAEDFPREALIYVQIADLPAFIKLWNESEFRGKYLESDNFHGFKNNHLGRKLTSRWEEFSGAAGFPIDLEAISGLAQNRAAIALYDIGKLEFVFIAPLSDEIFAATKFAQNRGKFSEETLDDGTIVYRLPVEADRGRQKQELIFTSMKGRFILATSEKLLAGILNNINEKQAKNRLIDEPSFSVLKDKIEPHIASVWINQAALNHDYYFKRYWLMSEVEDLKNIRAGIFDFEMREGKLIERRRFLLNETVNVSQIKSSQANETLSFLPEDAPFYRLQSADVKTIDKAIRETLFERQISAKKNERRHYYFSYDEDYYEPGSYPYLGENFDESIDDIEDEETFEKNETDTDFSQFFQSAKPQAVLTFTAPKILPAPMFVEFRRAAIFHLASPAGFNRESFEAAIAKKFSEQTMISAPGVKLNWETRRENDFSRRELRLPMLGWQASYVIRGNVLILTNNAEYLREIITARNPEKPADFNVSFSGLTVINLQQRENAYDRIFAELAEKNAADDFFTGNVKSLLDSASNAAKIEIRDNFSSKLYEQEIILTLK
ncbi:MAG TPA: hypothetical protein VK892_13055 [Pyrinomonadaceae bacterium]|nr:hypothetical protein [Pyrinomonadaceae bacterium]